MYTYVLQVVSNLVCFDFWYIYVLQSNGHYHLVPTVSI